ncbi:hypothetical protein [Clostridium kluyveri]|uniref:tRNA (Guanine-N1)-methyltransferase n=1 Tax=Clostridium kluyveri (strain ATCC 8527 / DSM 555 / NBRC 12016 / NCIMB 10680 / K1) TaxID=431943 RepID=A5N2L1_CLOK5|nr:hypothetical protein [Clostridium kluyveri]EDK35357.1 Conserved hypothetical protein [Clostridium kluyveri DSM 555]
MGKPSIFSKDYGKKMRQRRRNVIILVVACLLVITLCVIYIRGAFKDVVNTKNAKVNNSAVDKQTTDNNKNASQSSNKAETKEKDTKKENSYKIQLSDGRDITLTYEGDSSNKVFKSVAAASGDVAYDINPSHKNVILFDNAAQSILLIDIEGNKQDITNQQYVSTSGEVIQKSSQIASNPSYIWCSSPKFLDDGNIAYISQLPWIGKTAKYVWIENIQDKSHVMVQSVQGENIQLGELTEKGLTVIADGTTFYMTASGSVSQ